MTLSDEEVAQALAVCDDEPIHIPGLVQSFGCMLGISGGDGAILYASDSCETYLGKSSDALLNKTVEEALGYEVWHALCNAPARSAFAGKSMPLGQFDLANGPMEFSAFGSGDFWVVEAEPATPQKAASVLHDLAYLIENTSGSKSREDLFSKTVKLLRHLTGFDRVMIYEFDPNYNGEVVAESRRADLEPYLNLRFPHWDIPEQARDIMSKLPIRLNADAKAAQGVLHAARQDLPPLDCSLAATRGASPIYLQYLNNMGSQATMTMSLIVEGQLWGIISFHHTTPRLCPKPMRDALATYIPVFCSKLVELRFSAALNRVRKLEALWTPEDETQEPMMDSTLKLAPEVLDSLGAVGIYSIGGTANTHFGQVPETTVLQRLHDMLNATDDDVLAIHDIAVQLPDMTDDLNGCSGALLIKVHESRALCIFREGLTQTVKWAGNPAKEIHHVDGQLRLEPRGSFSTYLQQVEGQSQHWLKEDIVFIRHIRTLLRAAESEFLLHRLNRQRILMINELNHRVRNILALVRAVSQQSRRRYGSLDSYASAVENRVRALASAHDMNSDTLMNPLSVVALIQHEFVPYELEPGQQLHIKGDDVFLRPEVAPIFSLVVHELATNATKYGALSCSDGHVHIEITGSSSGCMVKWLESDGPEVIPPTDPGFGTALIKQAIPHELGGTAELEYLPKGVRAQFFIPAGNFVTDVPELLNRQANPVPVANTAPLKAHGIAMLLEDNFIIAREMADQLRDFGFDDVQVCSNLDDALSYLEVARPSVAFLDVNLGKDATSEPVANRLLDLEIPFAMITGYGNRAPLSGRLDSVAKLSKPVSHEELVDTLKQLLSS